MGTVGEWVSLSFYTIFSGGWMLFWTARKRKQAQIKPALLPSGRIYLDIVGHLPWPDYDVSLASVPLALADSYCCEFGGRAAHLC